ncbi:hypothetical protein GE21DRAFT_9000 [Neurospora crassa]|uniref:DUF833 domain-containing protein n=1 Tax=Neurospora crassa (strain ATCC 24698 / 74-OR23-1A / CBS 708.71 / DSM 1257 / FGSC 987) TaxID=367110 RepID=Q7S6R4_NEUCR|nr:DUF833 domain-containing protein [Neurospora crassa OR74A]EAA31251.1 DUF833 domain-containing protein [Neurospora crassa OR74A]KHE81676.1 hypothetical protein GE21DRAFT_9000 [Neurospora crassa]|eukprot:XP_960487.1 DUF833 domain-containing protein [Neurospora crassa OR74A]
MCIVLLTTAHPKYALIVIDNRDEYILRPTSKPHWWTALSESPSTDKHEYDCRKVEVISSRDLARAEHGTWLGMTKGGHIAVLTNYRETDTHDSAHPIAGKRSRGGMVTAWLAAHPDEPVQDFVSRMVGSGEAKDIGGFSLVCGKLRKKKAEKAIEPLAIISNRADHIDRVPWICGDRDRTYGLSNAIFLDPSEEVDESTWPKVRDGREKLKQVIEATSSDDVSEDVLVEELYKVLDTTNFPVDRCIDLEEGIPLLKNSIFIPAFGGKQHQAEMEAARQRGTIKEKGPHDCASEVLTTVNRPDNQPYGFQTGLYGTQRQTIILVDWDGNVTYRERALFDAHGNPIPRGAGDETFKFKIEGWEEAADGEPEIRS